MEELAPRVRDALHDLHQYLSDVVAPLIVTDAVTLLMEYPPSLLAAEIQNWTLVQYRGHAEKMPVSDYLFHGVKKIHLLGDFGLVPKEQLAPFLEQVSQLVLAYCPEPDRAFLRENLANLSRPQPLQSSPVEIIHRQMGAQTRLAGSPAASTPPVAETDSARTSRLLSLLLERFEKTADAPGASGGNAQLAAQILTAVASGSRDAASLDRDLERLRQAGVPSELKEVFETLGNSLPAWSPPAPEDPRTNVPVGPQGAPAEAMHRIIALAQDPAETARRMHEMVKAAVAQFNEGSLARAVTMYELADRLVEEGKVKPSLVETIRRNGHEFLSVDRIRLFAEKPEKHREFRKVLSFYSALRPEGLLDALQTEPKRDRRRLLLALVEVHGAHGREVVLGRLRSSAAEPAARDLWHIQRNLVYLLRRIPRPESLRPEEEIDVLTALLQPGRPAPVVKEAIANLSHIRHAKAEQALVALMGSLEERLLMLPPRDEAQLVLSLLDRLATGLVRMGTVNSRRCLANHGLRREPALGDTLARLAELGNADLAGDKALVEHLASSLQEELPRKVLGVMVKRNSKPILQLIQALSGTTSAAARDALTQVAEKFREDDFGQAARRALTRPAAAASGAPHPPEATMASVMAPETTTSSTQHGLSGDLDVFGLPNLLQTLAQSQVTGTLLLEDAAKEPIGSLAFLKGQLMSARLGVLVGEEALYQLIEKPAPATFRFLSQTEKELGFAASARAMNAVALLLEGMRRYDELRRVSVLVPDDGVLEPTGPPPTPHPEETDNSLAATVWDRASGGALPRECELAARTDSYRVRRLLAHWVEGGSLRVR